MQRWRRKWPSCHARVGWPGPAGAAVTLAASKPAFNYTAPPLSLDFSAALRALSSVPRARAASERGPDSISRFHSSATCSSRSRSAPAGGRQVAQRQAAARQQRAGAGLLGFGAQQGQQFFRRQRALVAQQPPPAARTARRAARVGCTSRSCISAGSVSQAARPQASVQAIWSSSEAVRGGVLRGEAVASPPRRSRQRPRSRSPSRPSRSRRKGRPWPRSKRRCAGVPSPRGS